MKKRMLAALLCLSLTAGLAVSAYAEEAPEETGFGEEAAATAEEAGEEPEALDALVTEPTALEARSRTVAYAVEGGNIYFDPETGTVTNCDYDVTRAEIPSEINGVRVTSIGDYAFYKRSSLTSVSIPNGVTSIGDDAFDFCSNLTSVSIPNGVTRIGDFAFFVCSGLTSVTIPNGVTTIGGRSFLGCSGLTSVSIPNSVTTIGDDAFSNCSSLAEIKVSAENPAYSDMDGVLFDKKGETLITCPGGIQGHYSIPSSVTSIGYDAFRGCSGLTSVTIPNSVTTIGDDAFSNCSSLAEIKVSAENSAYSDMDGVLFDKKGETLITCPRGRQGHYSIPSSVTSIGDYAFYFCWRLTSVIIPNSITTIGDYAFSNCGRLTSVTIPNSVTTIGGDAFLGCSGLTSVTIPDSVTRIGGFAFSDCRGLTEIKVSAENPAYSDIDGILFDKKGKTLITYPGGIQGHYSIPSSVTTIGDSAFRECSGLTSVTIPNSVTSIGDSAFSDCNGLTSVTIPNSVTRIWNNAFFYCSSLAEIKVSAENPAYSDIDGILFDKKGETLITYPGGIQGHYSIPSSVTSIGYDAFRKCSGLTSVTIPNSVTTIGNDAFYYCSGLTSVSIPNSVTSIGYAAFFECRGLTSVTIPDSVTSIPGSVFSGCSGLTSVTIPDSITSIGDRAFLGCSGLTDVYYSGSELQWDAISIGLRNPPLTSATIHYNSVLAKLLSSSDTRSTVQLPDVVLPDDAQVFAAHQAGGRFAGAALGTCSGDQVTFNGLLAGGDKLFFLSQDFIPLAPAVWITK